MTKGDFYEGDFVLDKKHGKGRYTSPEGDIYEGEWLDDQVTAKGTYTLANGTTYPGNIVLYNFTSN